MNKQEVIKKINNLEGLTILDKTINFDSKMISKEKVLNIVKQLDEPEKPVVPQYVADWLDVCKENLGFGLSSAMNHYTSAMNKQQNNVKDWFKSVKNQETFAKAWLYGYEVEKEKLYTVEIPNSNRVTEPIIFLSRGEGGKISLNSCFVYASQNWKNQRHAQLTESEIKEDFGWAWQFAKEVEE